MTIYTKLIAASFALMVAGCDKEPIRSEQTINAEIRADLLTVIDGCKIWRFTDGGHRRYFARCHDGSRGVSAEWDENCGKACVMHKDSTVLGERP
jgi:hypothetical protein